MAGDKQNKKQQQKQQQQQKPSEESSLVRVAKIPLVEFSIYLSLSVYGKVKSSSDLVANVLNKVEKIALSTFNSAKPVLMDKLGNQVSYVDSVANQALDKLETTVPSIVTFSPKNAWAKSVNRMNSWRTAVQSKLSVVSNLNISGQIVALLKAIDSKLDEYYPGTEAEARAEKDAEVDESVLGRSFVIFNKIKRRSLNRLQSIQRFV